MPRFFFNVHDGVSWPDDTGTDLPSCQAAKTEAIHLCGKILADTSTTIALGEDWVMEVLDQGGTLLFRLTFHVSASPAVTDDAGRAG